MLTKTDLNQIRKIFREEQGAEIGNLGSNLRSEIKLLRMGIQNEVRDLGERIRNVEIKLDKVIDFFDREYLEVRKRIKRLEDHFNLPPGF